MAGMNFQTRSRSVLQENQKSLMHNLLFIAVLMVAVAAILTTVISRSMIRPLDMLMETIWRMKGGESHLRTKIVNKDEIGELGQNFNEMLDQKDIFNRFGLKPPETEQELDNIIVCLKEHGIVPFAAHFQESWKVAN